jgi:hypothetical protein
MRLLPVLLACSLVPFAAGCGAQDSVKNAVDPVAQAATKTAAAGTMQVAMTGKVSAAGQEIPLDGTGVFDLKHKRGFMEMTTSVPGKGEVKIEELLDGLVIYIRSDAITAGLPGGKHWVRFDLEALGRKQGFDLGQLQQLGGGGSDPTQWLGYLKKAGSVDLLGSQEIHGTPTTHYRATIDLDKVADGAGDAASSVRQLEQVTGTKALPTEVWIDGQGRVRRQAVDISVSQPTAMHMQFTIDFERFGIPLDLHNPDAGDTVDLTDVIGG